VSNLEVFASLLVGLVDSTKDNFKPLKFTLFFN